MGKQPPQLLTRPEAALRARVSIRTIRRWGALGWLEEVHLSPHDVRIREISLNRHLREGYPKGAA